MGKLLGSREHAPVYIAFIVIVLTLISMVALFLLTSSKEAAVLGDIEKLLGTILLSTLTFLGGYLGSPKK